MIHRIHEPIEGGPVDATPKEVEEIKLRRSQGGEPRGDEGSHILLLCQNSVFMLRSMGEVGVSEDAGTNSHASQDTWEGPS